MNTHPNICTAETSLLLLVDIQTRLTAAMPYALAANMLTCSTRLTQAAQTLNIPVLITEQYPAGLGSTVTSLSNALSSNSRFFEKTGFSCCTASGFQEALEKTQRKQIILSGQETHVCILQTALALKEQGYQVFVSEDATCSRNIEHKAWALQRMQQQGVTISNHESVLFEWLKDASHPEFKTISKLLR